MDVGQVYEILGTGSDGLTEEEAGQRRAQYGPNKISQGKKRTLPEKIREQLANVMVLILAAAAGIALIAGDVKSTVIIAVVVAMNTILGIIQEGKAEKALEALQRISSPEAEVVRGGKARVLKAEELTVGDLVLLEAGDHVPADLRLVDAANLQIEEAALTGESVPAQKDVRTLAHKDLVLGDRKNMAFLGSTVVYGRGTGVVTAVGMDSEVGRIAGFISADLAREETPLQKKLAQMSKYVSIIIVIAAVLILVTGLLWGRSFLDIFLTAVSLAVAAIPEGLPAIVTIVLALGVQKMAARNAIIRKLPAVETLGSAEVICTDKTGTLTKNEMTVVQVFLNLEGLGAGPAQINDAAYNRMLDAMMLCNDTRVTLEPGQSAELTGDPTETALVRYAREFGLEKDRLEATLPRISEIPFDSDRKLMTTLHGGGATPVSYTKGALDVLLGRSAFILDQGRVRPLHPEDREIILEANREMAQNALRVLAFGYKEPGAVPPAADLAGLEEELVFIGFAGMIDPPRPEAGIAVRKCREAGIRAVMITGDHKETASAIARQLGILGDGDEAVEGRILEGMSDEELIDRVEGISVYARVSPEHKVRIVKAWKARGKVTAMTGDGVNDAPALKTADIGIGMGITGTDVAKGVSDMVLADDNFATIITAVEEGRRIYSNIRKAVHFLLSTHLGEVLALFVATLLNWVILVPIHLLWVNLIIDTLPALALGMEKPDADIMRRNPRKSNQNFFAEGLGRNILSQGFFKGMLVLAAYALALNLHTQEVAVTTAFATLGLVQLFHTFTLRSETESIFRLGLFSNPHLVAAVLVAALLQAGVILIPALNGIFQVQQLYWQEWLISLGASAAIVPIVEVQKWMTMKRTQRR